MALTIKQLTNICKYYMFELWGDQLEVQIKVSGRIKKSLGYFQHTVTGTPLNITFSKGLLENYKLSTIESVIKHELCHYHLFKTKQPYADGHPVFESELMRIGGSSTKVIATAGVKHYCVCKKCGKEAGLFDTENKARKIEKAPYISRCCRSRLAYAGVKMVEDKTKAFEAQIKTMPLEEVLKLTDKQINNYINGKGLTLEPTPVKKPVKKVKETKETNSDFNINDYVKVTSKKPTQGNVYDTLVILIDNENKKHIYELFNLYEKHSVNCIKYLSKKRKQYLYEIGIKTN